MANEILLTKADYLEVEGGASVFEGGQEDMRDGTETSSSSRPDGLPLGYELYPEGLFFVDSDGIEQLFGSWLRVMAVFREATGMGWGKVIELRDPAGVLHVLTFLEGEIAGAWTSVLVKLVNHGFVLEAGKGNEGRLQKLLQSWRPKACQRRVNRAGVHRLERPVFVLGNGEVVGARDVIAGGAAVSPLAAAMQARGTAEEWREGIGRLCVGNPLLTLAVSLGFFGPILGLVDPDMAGGFHLGGASSRGKSTVAEVVVSIWGEPRLKQSWSATANGLEAVAAALSGHVLVLDEIGEATAKVVGEAIYRLANGTG